MNRIYKIQKLLEEWEVDFLVVDDPIDLFYLTGQDISTGRLIIFEKEATLYVDGRYYERCKQNALVSVKLHSKKCPFPFLKGKRGGFDTHFTTFETYEKLATLCDRRVALSNPLQAIREVKEKEEIAFLRQAAELGSKGFDFVLTQLKEGVTEEQLAVALEVFWKKAGADRLAFIPHIAFGINSAYPHYHPSQRPLQQGDCIVIDIGVVLDHYHSDMTRVLFFAEPKEELKTIYQIVREAQQRALDKCKPETPIAELDRVARDFIDQKGYGAYFLHSLGHGLGLEIHEPPWIREKAEGYLEEGMVLTIEPGIYLPALGGVRLEDTIVITKQGFENLTNRPILASLPIL